ncbi:hypothetical protein P175DRAFT_0500250 [Aspergillus ochraceoroseus IBT 24754]|uniref:F-box domain-containing protein n=3 Tax=Aspergillus subgen. Nidulantes TaxID=2720870 RepID=A0A0F8UWS2_9EURO|nr:uncharacterized protein P175DRAFT_0500250 [Aspergillus ochraceoroseus IBT 24754]KKK14554.1 hypothetical protein AOCH_001967 [Aspergillus ochraceoroseus]KKK15261.1 hypothetical protein ARAM_001911 [Aspergillus rambellii]PTU21345.1 hypothetical protein P175DRAFT_0500250 [Aspergillus ochraceoroseus IBT 24754]
MPSQPSPFELLPNELLDQIISLISTPPPSLNGLHKPPNTNIISSKTRDLKYLSRTCSRFLNLVRPLLFAHSCFNVKDVDGYLSFISKSDLAHKVTSIVVIGKDSPESREDPLWWRRVLGSIDPLRITVVAPPLFIGAMLGMKIMDGHSWAFEISSQILHLERNRRTSGPTTALRTDGTPSLLDARPWSSMLFNESSSLKAYNHYEYFLFLVPSLFTSWGTVATSDSQLDVSRLSMSLQNITSFTYVAVFPFYNHVKLVQDAVGLMKNLQTLIIRLGPSRNDRITEIEQRGSMDPSDPWMELATGYSLIAHDVRDSGNMGRLEKFIACDYEFDALRAELSSILGDMLEQGGWAHDDNGTWIKKPVKTVTCEDNSLARVEDAA